MDPLAVLLRERYASRAELARVSGLGYQMLRTYTDGRWTADQLPPVRVMAALSQAVDPGELLAAARQAMLERLERGAGPPALSFGQRVVLEALRGFDDELLVAVAPHVHDLVAAYKSRPVEDPERPGSSSPGVAGAPTTGSSGLRVQLGPTSGKPRSTRRPTPR